VGTVLTLVITARTVMAVHDRLELLAAAQAIALGTGGEFPVDVPGSIRTVLTEVDAVELLENPAAYGMTGVSHRLVASTGMPPASGGFPVDVDPADIVLELATDPADLRGAPAAGTGTGFTSTSAPLHGLVIVDVDRLLQAAASLAACTGRPEPHSVADAVALLAAEVSPAELRAEPEQYGLSQAGVPRQRTHRPQN
jgi:hypothetical protein